MSVDLNGQIKMSNCDVLEDDFDLRSLSSMKLKKLINSLEYLPTADKENSIPKKEDMFSTLPLRKHHSVTGPLGTNSPLRSNKRVHSVEIPVTVLPQGQPGQLFQTDLDQGVAKLRVTPDEAREIMKFINDKIASRTSLQTAGTDTRPVQECVPEEPPRAPFEEPPRRLFEEPPRPLLEEHPSERAASEGETPAGFNSLPLLYRSGDISVKEVDKEENVNDLSDMKLDGAKPKLSFLNKLKKSFGKTDKKQPNIPQLSRPPSTYIGSQTSLNGSDHSQRGVSSPALEKPQTPVMDLLAKNPEMCSQDSLNRLTRGGDIRAVMSDPDLANSVATGRSRSKRPRDGKVKEKRRSRSRSLSKFMSDMARKAKSLTEVSPIPPQGEHPGSPTYQHQPLAPPTPLSPPPPIRAEQVPEEHQKPPKKKISLVGRIKRSLSIGKGDKEDKLSKKKELSKSTPTLSEPRDSLSALPPHIKRARSSENMSTTSSLTSTDVRTQIVLKSAKINKGCRCQVCSLVRRNIRSHCGSRDPHSKHKYEVVLKMNLLGTDFMNSECGSISSHQELLGCEVPDRPVVEGCDVITNDLITGGSEVNCNQLRTKTQSEIQEILHDFREETGSVSSSNTDVDISDIGNLTSTSSPRQSAV